jgi:hypothetical protein
LHGFQRISKTHDSSSARNKVDIKMLVIRIERVQTDICIYFNTPVELSSKSSSAIVGTQIIAPFTKDQVIQFLGSFRVVNWQLFGEE